ncbi:MAG: hypothetical protein CMJ76_07585 [Planctomycetaceae bacterium]|nr:hypothetical protein [Planctomycetaceae bacterium]|tara:strand:+ start:105 stop:1115 length:1011 start_codon:yes stop_codon:yes gene_type:complete
MKYKLPILTGLIFAGFLLFGAKNGYQNNSIPPSVKAQTATTLENNSSLNVGIPIDANGIPTDVQSESRTGQQTADGELLTDPEVILKRAIAQLNSESRFQASVRHKIHMFDQQLVGTGHYRQFGKGSIKRLRFELKTQVGEKTSSVIQVCDGRHLWTRENLSEGTTLSRIDVRYIQDELAEYERENGVGKLAVNWGANIAMGGLPRLLTSVDSCFDFISVTEANYEDVPVWVLTGIWKPQVKQRIIEQFNSGAQLPAHLPNAVKLILGRDVEFKLLPREIQYLRVLADKTTRPMVSLQLYDMTRLVDMNASQFDYQRGEQVIVDRTQAFIDKHISK